MRRPSSGMRSSASGKRASAWLGSVAFGRIRLRSQNKRAYLFSDQLNEFWVHKLVVIWYIQNVDCFVAGFIAKLSADA